MADLATDLTRMTDRNLRAWITGDTDWTDTRETAARILDLPDEAYTEAEKRSENLARIRDELSDAADGSVEWKSAASAYSSYFVRWVTGAAA